MSSSTVEDGVVVIFHYTLRDDDGEVLDSSVGEDPLPILQGAGNIVPGLESALVGKSAGDEFEVDVPPAEGYGERLGPGPQEVDRAAFPEGVEIHVGMPFFAEGPEGEDLTLWVTAVTDATVSVDHNHPLAGQTLHFEIAIDRLREATADEKAHGHPHGLDGTAGHHH